MAHNEIEHHQQQSKNRSEPVVIVEQHLNFDNIPSTQAELAPNNIPDGGYGWIVFLGTLFFQAVLPNLLVSYGIFIAFARLENNNTDREHPKLWDEKLLYVPLFFTISRTGLAPLVRRLILKSTWPRLVGISGTSLTCAGLLFVWMGMTGNDSGVLYIIAGTISGFGTALQLVQCDLILSQYFRLRLPILHQISKMVATFGFIIGPILLGHHIINTNLLNVILWYQTIILQGLVINLLFRKPKYLKSRPKIYQFITSNPDDEEDIFTKNSRELQIKRQTSNGGHEISRIETAIEPSTSTSTTVIIENQNKSDGWEKFGDDDVDNEENDDKNNENKPNNWIKFDNDDEINENVNNKSLAEEMSTPSPLFSDLPVNNNTTYSYDDDETRIESRDSTVFMPAIQKNHLTEMLAILKQLTFYKSLLMITTNHYSVFLYYSIFPSYLYIEVDTINLLHASNLIGILSLVTLVFLVFSYWIQIDKKWRPLCLWILCWIGSVGYFMLSDYKNEQMLLYGAIQVVLSIATLDHIGNNILGITIRGETGKEYGLLCILSSLLLSVFFITDMTFKSAFRLLSVLHFLVGTIWLSNYVYKRISA